jgi:hypothetical protein
MIDRAYCLAKAEECEADAARAADEKRRAEWLRMAQQWRIEAELPFAPEPEPGRW